MRHHSQYFKELDRPIEPAAIVQAVSNVSVDTLVACPAQCHSLGAVN